jgi:hypothetical protein
VGVQNIKSYKDAAWCRGYMVSYYRRSAGYSRVQMVVGVYAMTKEKIE